MDPAMALEVAAMSRQRAVEEATARGDSDIQRFYCNSTVFITGGSGFMGKQLIEKLFRSCQPKKIFVLLRSKKGKDIQDRFDIIFQDTVFDTLRKQQPDFEQKICLIKGDTADIKLGVSDEDWKTLTEEVDVIYHLAATTRFDEALKLATFINLRGTREVISLGKACKNLKSFVHVSTAYSSAIASLIKQEVFEKFYPSPISPETLISMAETMQEDTFNGLTENLIQGWPNTYTFTKAVADELVRTTTDGLPICIVRPGVDFHSELRGVLETVFGAFREPTPGWLDFSCVYGATGVLLGVALGLMHVLLASDETRLGLVPCDYVNNAIIAASKEASGTSGGESTKIYVVSSNVRNPVTQERLETELDKNGRKYVTPKSIYYNFSIVTSNKLLYSILTWILHFGPAYIVDIVCLLLGKERRFVKLYKKINKMSNALSYFSLNHWLFVDKNLEGLYDSLSKNDKTIFNFDLTDIDWAEYIPVSVIGLRKYIIKDGLKGTEYAIKKQFWLRILHYVLTALYFFCLWKLFSFVYYVLNSFVSILF